MDSSLSSVPPVWPSPLPEIIGTAAPQAATIGASISETLSPTPPVECLSVTGPGRSDQSSTSPESRMAMVSATASSRLMPLRKTAMAKAPTWPSEMAPQTFYTPTDRGFEKRVAERLAWWEEQRRSRNG